MRQARYVTIVNNLTFNWLTMVALYTSSLESLIFFENEGVPINSGGLFSPAELLFESITSPLGITSLSTLRTSPPMLLEPFSGLTTGIISYPSARLCLDELLFPDPTECLSLLLLMLLKQWKLKSESVIMSSQRQGCCCLVLSALDVVLQLQNIEVVWSASCHNRSCFGKLIFRVLVLEVQSSTRNIFYKCCLLCLLAVWCRLVLIGFTKNYKDFLNVLRVQHITLQVGPTPGTGLLEGSQVSWRQRH